MSAVIYELTFGKKCDNSRIRPSHAHRQKKYMEKYPGKQRARERFNRAVRNGKISRLGCEVCGAKAEAHHSDYRKPFVVNWLCKKHHVEVHYGR